MTPPNPMDLKQVRINGRKAREYVHARKPFRNSNGQLYSLWLTPLLYVVYSYGTHWPLVVWDGFGWFINTERASRTTSKHMGQARPFREVQGRTCRELRDMIEARCNDHRMMSRNAA